ncbi:hypothetical protein ACWDR1_29410 [Streptosporangium sandarakinum]
MTAVLLIAAGLAVLAVRPLERAAGARTPAQFRAALRAAGWSRVTARVLQVAVVTVLLVLAVACRLLWHTAHGVGTVLAAAALGLAALGAGPALRGGRA